MFIDNALENVKMNIVTYSSENAKPEYRWVGYIVLANGDYLSVMFRAASEEAVKAKAEQFWQTETKRPINQMVDDDEAEVKAINADPWAIAKRGQQFVGKVWMINEVTREKRRVLPDEVEALGPGWVKGGPRSR